MMSGRGGIFKGQNVHVVVVMRNGGAVGRV